MQGHVCPFPITFVDRDDVGHLKEARFHGLDFIAEARGHDRYEGLDHLGDIHLVLPYANGFNQDDLIACCLEHRDRVTGRTSQAPMVAPRSHAADKDAGISVVRLTTRPALVL